MGQKENKEQLLRLHGIITGTSKTLEQITAQWDIDPNISLIHNTELSGKVPSNRAISINDYYPLDGEQFDTRSRAEARV